MRLILNIALLIASMVGLWGIETSAKSSVLPYQEVRAENEALRLLRLVREQSVATPISSYEAANTTHATLSVRLQGKSSSRHHWWGDAEGELQKRIAIRYRGGYSHPQAAAAALARCELCWLCRLII